MTKKISLDALWSSALLAESDLCTDRGTGIPEAAQRYLDHAIAPNTKLASAVRLRMHGEIKLRGWLPFTAEQVICWNRGMIWRATVWMNGLPVVGSDSLVDGVGAMHWKLLGLFPMVNASGSDITRSAGGRVQAESIWLPSIFCRHDVAWTTDDSDLCAKFAAQGETATLLLTLDDRGQLKTLRLSRWGNPEGNEFHYADFGGIVEEEGTFDGYTIPTRLRIGWYFGTDQFASEGEFFRVTVDSALYR